MNEQSPSPCQLHPADKEANAKGSLKLQADGFISYGRQILVKKPIL